MREGEQIGRCFEVEPLGVARHKQREPGGYSRGWAVDALGGYIASDKEARVSMRIVYSGK